MTLTRFQLEVAAGRPYHPLPPGFRRGTTPDGFDKWLCLVNPGGKAALLDITYIIEEGFTRSQNLQVVPNTRATVEVTDAVSRVLEVPVFLASSEPIQAEGPMCLGCQGTARGAAG